MEVISSKVVSCETIKVMYDKGENFREDIRKRKLDGWRVVAYKDDILIKWSSGIRPVLTYKRYGYLPVRDGEI